VAHPAQTKTIAMGRRWGKTFMAGVYALTVADYGGAVAWVVPVYKNARAPWRFAETMIAPVAGRLRMNRTERVIEFPSGGRLSIYSADNDVALRGEAFDLVIVDEAAQVREETYTDVLMPTLADRDGRIVLISTPKGRNWFWREWLRGRSGEQDCASWTAPSAANPMPTIRRAAEMARERVGERTFRQEWLAEFVEDGGSVFRGVQNAATAPLQDKAQAGHSYAIGADWGRTNDATVFTVLDMDDRAVVAQDRFTHVEYAHQLGRLRAMHERFNPVTIIAESNSMGGPLVEALQRMNLPVQSFNTTNASKAAAIDALALAFERGDIRILNDPTLIAELQAYEMERLPSGLYRYSAPDGMHDDCVISLALAWQAVANYVPLLF